MVTVIYYRAGCGDVRYFWDVTEYLEWEKREKALHKDYRVIRVTH